MKINYLELNHEILNWVDVLAEENIDITVPKYYVLKSFAVIGFKYCDFSIKLFFTDNPPEMKFRYPQYHFIFVYPDSKENKIFIAHDFLDLISKIESLDFEKIRESIEREEIEHNYYNPISFINLYDNFGKFKSNSEPNLINRGISKEEYERSVQGLIAAEMGSSRFSTSHDHFCNHSNFITFFSVYIFDYLKVWSTRRSDISESKREYCLFYRGIRVNDGYIKDLLPESIVKSESEYNDSTPCRNFKKLSYQISFLETERFLEKYNLEEHCNFLAPHLNTLNLKFMKVEKQVVYHEFGHLIGIVLSSIIGYDLGPIEEICLDSRENKSYIKLKNNLYTYKSDLSNEKKQFEIQKIQQKLNEDKKQVITYIMYLISGAVFNIYYFKIKPNLNNS